MGAAPGRQAAPGARLPYNQGHNRLNPRIPIKVIKEAASVASGPLVPPLRPVAETHHYRISGVKFHVVQSSHADEQPSRPQLSIIRAGAPPATHPPPYGAFFFGAVQHSRHMPSRAKSFVNPTHLELSGISWLPTDTHITSPGVVLGLQGNGTSVYCGEISSVRSALSRPGLVASY